MHEGAWSTELHSSLTKELPLLLEDEGQASQGSLEAGTVLC